MPFDSKSASEAGKRSKRGPVKKELPTIKEKMEMLYEKVLENQQWLDNVTSGDYKEYYKKMYN